MLKLTGIMGLILSFGLFGISRTINLKTRIELLEDYYEMIMVLKGQINYFKEPLPDLFNKISKTKESKAYIFIKELGREIEKKGDYNGEFWAEKLKCIYQDTVITNEDIEIMSYLGEFIGQTDFNNHIQHFSYIEEKLKKQIEKAKYSYEKKAPMFNKIGFFVGAVVSIILI